MIALWAAAVCAAVIGLLGGLEGWRLRRLSARLGGAGGTRRPPGHRAPGRPRSEPEWALVVTEVAARLRAGAPVARAWEQTWARAPDLGLWLGMDEDGAPRALKRLAGSRVRWPPGRVARRRSRRRVARELLAACRFSDRLGAPLAQVLDRVADGVEESTRAEDARRVALAGPRASMRVLTALPLAGVILGEVLGAHPVATLLGGGLGTACLAAGALLVALGYATSRRMLVRAEAGDDRMDECLLADLAVAGLDSGASIPRVLEVLGWATGDPTLGRVSRELLLGASWGEAWDGLRGGLLRDALEPAWEEGISPAPLLARGASALRARRLSRAQQAAGRLGVRLTVPLGAFLLPAFVLLGIVPVIMALLSGELGGLFG